MVEIFHLSNNTTVVMEQMNHVRSVSFGLWVRAGSVNESKHNNGCAHMLEHMFFKGTKNRTARKLADDISAIGGNMNAFTSKECTSFYFTTIDKCIYEGIEILSDMIFDSLFDDEEFEREKSVVLEEIDMYEDTPDDVVHEYTQIEVWNGHSLSYNISGTKEIVEKLTVNDVLEFKNRYYIPDNITISVAGCFDREELINKLEYYFGETKIKAVSGSTKNNIIQPPLYTKSVYKRHMDTAQVHINIAFPCVTSEGEERYVAAIANSIIGGNDNSRLFQHIREEMGAAYSVCSYLNLYSIAGLMHIEAVVNPSNADKVVEAIFDDINVLREDGITETELSLAKAQYEIDTILSSDSPKGMMNRNGNQYVFRHEIISKERVIDEINAITVSDVNSFIRKYVIPDMASFAYAGNIKG